ncbi:hypothetical protein [Pendulispora albinea]|uniref:Kazal-like domain-containing protein n=1 Tax=Pendulispora albinea TaxID=2741071 RepID=A0ABZ2M0U4_9BACT
MSSDDGGPNGPTRVCSRTQSCYFDEYCDYADGKCGNGADGICKPRPETCTEAAAPQCGCDGKRYTMTCEAHRAGIDDSPDACPPDSQPYFACGTTKCLVGQEYCLVTGLLAAKDFACRPFNGCSAANCSCKLDQQCLGGRCIEVHGGGSWVDCSL